MGKHKRKKTGRKHLSKSKLKMEKIKDVKILHYVVPMRNVSGICLVAETGCMDTLFTSKHCFFVEETVGPTGHPRRNYSLDNKDYAESMLNKFLNANIFVEFKDTPDNIKENIPQILDYYVSMSHYTLYENAKINLLKEQECYDLISRL